jgi:RNA polymerase sigma-70 factor (TIGR02960 family)
VPGSFQDAEDAMQETLVAAWRRLRGCEERSSLRTWLHRIATNRCPNLLRAGASRAWTKARPVVEPPPSALGEVLWLEPYPDVLLGDLADPAGPEARYDARESISLAFVTAVQLLPPRQRAALILRDVMGFSAAEVAAILESTEESATSALERARATVQHRLDTTGPSAPPPPPGSPEEEALVAGLIAAFEAGDVDRLLGLLADDVRLSMPPMPFEYHGRGPVAEFFRVAFRPDRAWRLVPTRANGQPAFGVYVQEPQGGVAHADGLFVVTLAGDRVGAITRFDAGLLPLFGLPRTLPGGRRR